MYRITYLFVFSLFLLLSACEPTTSSPDDNRVEAPGEEVKSPSVNVPKTAPIDSIGDIGGITNDQSTGMGKTDPKPNASINEPVKIKPGTVSKDSKNKSDNKAIANDQKTADQKTVARRQEDTSTPVDAGDKSSLDKIASTSTNVNLSKAPSFNKPDHTIWGKQLSQYVSAQGQVDYAGWKRAEANLDAYLKELSDNPIASDWSRNEQMAYWINAYNAFTVKLILKNYPVQKITNLDGGKPWDVKWIKLDNKTYSLNQIENDILRPRYGDARIHFAVNCAAVSCPPLMNKAYTAGNLNSSLAANARAFINNNRYNSLSESSAEVSKIFDWYKSDFGDLREYLNQYAKTKLADDASINFKDYDWSLNGK